MNENKSPWAIVQIGVGIICILIGVSGFILSKELILSIEPLILGVGVLLIGLAGNRDDSKSRKLYDIGSIFLLIATGLIFYNTFFHSK